MRMALTVLTLVLNVLSILLLAATVVSVKLDMAAQIVCFVFAGVLALNSVAIQFGGRFGAARPKRDEVVGAFD
jgi:hypothetical protein